MHTRQAFHLSSIPALVSCWGSAVFSLQCQHFLRSTKLIYTVILKTAFPPSNEYLLGLLCTRLCCHLVICLDFRCSCIYCHILLEHHWSIWGTSSLLDLDACGKLCPLWGFIGTVSGDCGSRGGGRTEEPERAVKAGVIAGELPLRH